MSVRAIEFEECFREQYPRLVALGEVMTGDREVARELAQEAMLRTHQHWSRVGDYEAPGGWARRVMVNLTIDHLRSRRAERGATSRLAAQPAGEASVEGSLGDAPDWVELVAPLPDRQRVIATLYYGEDWPVEQIADALGIRSGTVKSALAKARSHLAAALADDDGRRR